MGIPGLINAIGPGDRIALSRLAVTHLERTSRPIRIAVDISIWLFQVQSGRGGTNPELRTLFYRLLKFLALPVHPLFVYDGRHKPPFKRGKAVGGRSYGSAPIIGLSKTLIDLFRFPRHDAPGEAEAECARLQKAGVVDAVMSNDVDALMFGSSLTVMNFSKEKSSGTGAATHITCYRTCEEEGMPKNVPLDSDAMVLFALLSGGDYLPSGVPKCGSKLAAEIARAGFGSDLLDILRSGDADAEARLGEWRARLQYELDENESGYFQTKHKAVKIPETFPDKEILSYYANPVVSSDEELEVLRRRLADAWDHEIDALELRMFASDFLDWKYRSGARKIVRCLAEPLVSYRLRLQKPATVLQGYGSFVPNTTVPTAQRVYKSRTHWSTDGMPQLQMDMVPIDVVGLDLEAEEPNPPLLQQEVQGSEDVIDEEDGDSEAEAQPQGSQRPAKFYNPYEPMKIWVLETLAEIGTPGVVDAWRREQLAKTTVPKKKAKPAPKKTTTKGKKKTIDPGMKPGSLFKYYTTTKPRSEMASAKQSRLLDAARSSTTPESSPASTQEKEGKLVALERTYPKSLDELVDEFCSAQTVSDIQSPNSRRPAKSQNPKPNGRTLRSNAGGKLDGNIDDKESLALSHPSPPQNDTARENADRSKSTTAKATRRSPRNVVTPPAQATSVKEEKRSSGGQKKHQTVTKAEATEDTSSPDSSKRSPTASGPEKSKARARVHPRRKDTATLELADPSPSPSPDLHADADLPALEDLLGLKSEPKPSGRGSRTEKTKVEVTREAPIKNETATSVQQLQTCSRKPNRRRRQRMSAGHAYSVTTQNGSWRAGGTSDDETDADKTGNTKSSNVSPASGKRNSKKLPRVSIIDLT
ncbi:rad2-like endonuclease [Paecilomyces variotii No. 5]|uniref:Rad2-like endonuclease n=1 Tax=Byssochlamys spectabilis (strain No. 5 / NBRC 109023) TaxID=1356009 RepID=V5FGI9_BYSSN|nr:rad2-like endonuclease [Paecilomyces variotii No. 5]